MAVIPVNNISKTIIVRNNQGISGLASIEGKVAIIADIIPDETPANRISNCSEMSIRLIFLI